MSSLGRILGVGVVGASLVGMGLNWQRVRAITAPADAIAAPTVARDVPTRIRAEGRLVAYPGALVTVGTDVGGTIKALRVLEKAVVKKGDVLAEIDAAEQRAAYAEARARVHEAEVDMKLFDVELRRSENLFASNVLARDAVDRSQHDLAGAAARKETASASASRLGAVLGKARIVAPIDGVVIARLAEAGETVAQGAQLVTICDVSRTRIEAEVDEYDATRVTVGADVRVRVEGSPGRVWMGKIEEIPDTVTSRRIKPEDPGRPIDTRVLPVKIALLEEHPIKLGQRVQVDIQAAPQP